MSDQFRVEGRVVVLTRAASAMDARFAQASSIRKRIPRISSKDAFQGAIDGISETTKK